jgi:hypothetical protein
MIFAKLPEGFDLGIPRFENLPGDPNILGQIDTSTMFENDLIEMIEKGKKAPVDLEIEGQAVTFQGNREPVPIGRTVEFEHGQE